MVDYRENKKWTVYVHISPSNKYYVGITSMIPTYRWANGQGYCTQIFYRAIEKYGWNNFEHEIFASNLTKEEAEQIEIKLILLLASNDYRYGYNIDGGGSTKKNVSDCTRQKISKNHADVSYENNNQAKEVYQFTLKGEFVNRFKCQKEASEKTGIDRHSISCANVRNKTAGGYLWFPKENVEFIDNEYKIISNKYLDKRYVLYNKEIYCFDENKKFLNKFCSTSLASKETNIPRSSISGSALHKQKKAGKYKLFWRYKDDIKHINGTYVMKE